MIPGSTSRDTSVVLCLLVGEPADQYDSAVRFLREQLNSGHVIHVEDLVVAEAYFALQSFYHLSKKESLAALSLFAIHSGVRVSAVAASVLALPNLASANPGFVDRLIHGASHSEGHTLVTFEKASKKLPATHLLLA